MMQLRLLDIGADAEQIERIWADLSGSGAPSYFLSWGWMETWLQRIPRDVNIRLAVFEEGGEPVAAAFLGLAQVTRRKIFRSKAYSLNETGLRPYDQVFTEYNSFLTRPNATVSLADVVRLLPGNWEEICLSGIDPRLQPGCFLGEAPPGYRVHVVNRMPSPYVDLEAAAKSSGDYLSLLSGNTRSQVKRAYKLYQERGPLETRVAEDAPAALAFYEEMKALHAKAWQRKGDIGAFTNPWFDEFHRSLIAGRFSHGEIQMLRVACGGVPIGILYNFVHGGDVYYYQAGFRYEDDNRLKPGYLTHAEAIKHSARCGHRRYLFLAGYEDLKLRLSTDMDELVWARVQKPKLKFTLENWARQAALWAVDRYESRGGRIPNRRRAAEALEKAAERKLRGNERNDLPGGRDLVAHGPGRV